MYIAKDNLHELELLVLGYYAALYQHNIDEQIPTIGLHFLDWLRYKKNWSTNQGWAKAIYDNPPENLSPLDMFFILIDQYRQLKLKVLAQITLISDRNSTSKLINSVLPSQIFIIQYDPEPLFFLKSVFASHFIDQSYLADRPEKVMAFAHKEFQVEFSEWIWLH